MITVRVERSGLDIHVFAGNIREGLVQPLIEHLAERAEQIMRDKAPIRTGLLRASIRREIKDTEAIISSTAPYSIFIEMGSRPHEIKPVFAKALRFEVAGEVIFAARVHHPGSRPKPFLSETADQVIRELPIIYEIIFRGAVKG